MTNIAYLIRSLSLFSQPELTRIYPNKEFSRVVPAVSPSSTMLMCNSGDVGLAATVCSKRISRAFCIVVEFSLEIGKWKLEIF
ncbi:hypothetical protein A2692_05760 [Candidatus Woesebacteria bacterium RIFCSPHIGHO2_01_FULL_39_95]|nr:MAG: hypothetical protein A2692_05760 [Candidatus Woesebacteria bacterium RIFCSPHIGHO2_01_FULL_39_95]